MSGATALTSRIRWAQGRIDEAIDVLPVSAGDGPDLSMNVAVCNRDGGRRRRTTSLPGVPRVASVDPTASTEEEMTRPAALHVLTNSLPHTRSGYAYRSHAILTTLQDAGHRVAAATRPSYPVTIGRLSSGPVETVEGIDYLRQIPLRPLSTPTARLNDQASWVAAHAGARCAGPPHDHPLRQRARYRSGRGRSRPAMGVRSPRSPRRDLGCGGIDFGRAGSTSSQSAFRTHAGQGD